MIERIRRFIREKGPKTRLDIAIVVGSFAILAGLIGTGLFFAVTYPGSVDILYENRTGENVEMYIDGRYDASVRTDESVTSNVFDWGGNRLVEAVDGTGRVLFAKNVSKADLEQMEHRIVIVASTR